MSLANKAKELQVGEDLLSAYSLAERYFTEDELKIYDKEAELAEKLYKEKAVTNEQLEQAFIDAGLEPAQE